MKTASASLLLGVCVLLLSALTVSAVFVNVSPNCPQFFPGESVTLRCEGAHSSDGWTLKRQKNYNNQIQTCGGDFGQFDGSSCIIVMSDSASYWCETRAEQKSDKLDIFVSDHVILEIPALPVMAGSTVTLHCRPRYQSYTVRFITRERSEWKRFPAVHTIYDVQKSDEGFYSCTGSEYDMMMRSPQSRLTVAVPPPTTETSIPPPHDTSSSSAPPPPQSVSVLRAFCHLLVFCPFLICTVLLLSICYSRNKNSGKEPADSEHDDVTDDVTTEHEF